MGFYVESSDRPYMSGIAQEDIPVGTIVMKTGAGQVNLTDDTDTEADGVAASPRSAPHVGKEDNIIGNDDTLTEGYVYKASENDRVPYGDLDEAAAVFKARTITDNGTDPAPTISDGTVVGIAHKNDDAFRGRLVEEGYTDNGGTQYGDGGAGGFTAVGEVHRDESSNYDEAVRFVVQN